MLGQVFRSLGNTSLLQISRRSAKNASVTRQLSRNQGAVRQLPYAYCCIESCFDQVKIALGIFSFYAHSWVRAQKCRQLRCNPHPAESTWQRESQKAVVCRSGVAGFLLSLRDYCRCELQSLVKSISGFGDMNAPSVALKEPDAQPSFERGNSLGNDRRVSGKSLSCPYERATFDNCDEGRRFVQFLTIESLHWMQESRAVKAIGCKCCISMLCASREIFNTGGVMKRSISLGVLAVMVGVGNATSSVSAASVEPAAEAVPAPRFLMRLHAPLYPPDSIGAGLLVFHPRDGGSVDGPEIHGVLEQPGGDWVRMLPDGSMRIDVRLLIKLDDGSTALMTYGGVLAKPSAESWKRFLAGDPVNAPAWHYVIAPTFETASGKYGWLNQVQGIGKFVSIQTGLHAQVTFDVYDVQ
jgi:hypothetical protein